MLFISSTFFYSFFMDIAFNINNIIFLNDADIHFWMPF